DMDALAGEAARLGCSDRAQLSALLLTRLGESGSGAVYSFDAAGMAPGRMYVEFLRNAGRRQPARAAFGRELAQGARALHVARQELFL
ncbi:MAG: hypothetical protein ACI4L8_01085, partial [Candidatus Fimadaptatus sp.]